MPTWATGEHPPPKHLLFWGRLAGVDGCRVRPPAAPILIPGQGSGQSRVEVEALSSVQHTSHSLSPPRKRPSPATCGRVQAPAQVTSRVWFCGWLSRESCRKGTGTSSPQPEAPRPWSAGAGGRGGAAAPATGPAGSGASSDIIYQMRCEKDMEQMGEFEVPWLMILQPQVVVQKPFAWEAGWGLGGSC